MEVIAALQRAGTLTVGNLMLMALFALCAGIAFYGSMKIIGHKESKDELEKLANNEGNEIRGYSAKKSLMTETEKILFFKLKEIADTESLLVFSQVQLTGFINVLAGKGQQTRLNKIHRKSVDFLICDDQCNTLVAIELQDWTHKREERKFADSTKANALEEAGIRLVEFDAQEIKSMTREEIIVRLMTETTNVT